MKKYVLFLLFSFYYFFAYSQQNIVFKGKITDKQNRGIENASVLVMDKNENNLGYNFTGEKGNYAILLKKIPIENLPIDSLIIEVSCLGYNKKTQIVKISATSNNNFNFIFDFILEENAEILNEVVVEAGKKIKITQDTTSYVVSGFTNNTEQTLEDVLKKIPGIAIDKEGNIKAHGKAIDKLLIEGEDVFDKNYKLLSKNLDAKVLEEIQIIDNFEDNPIFKKFGASDKVALNLKLKEGLANVWFGNVGLGKGVILGDGITSDARWKNSVNLGLLRKKIKLFYLGDFNNIGEKATTLISDNTIQMDMFGIDRYEYKTNHIYSINNNEINFFSKTQSIFNNSFLNSLSINKRLKKHLSLRGVAYLANDKQTQNSTSLLKYNLDSNPIQFKEENFYQQAKILSAIELELKYTGNEKNYITNQFVFKNNPERTQNNLLFNTTQIDQFAKYQNYTFYNHLNHTNKISSSKILNNYFYFGNNNIDEKAEISSPFLNKFLDIPTSNASNATIPPIIQHSLNNLLYFGGKSKLLSKFKKFEISNSLLAEYRSERINSTFVANNLGNNQGDNLVFEQYQNAIQLKQLKFSSDNSLRYNLSKNKILTATIGFQNIIFGINNQKNSQEDNVKHNIFIFNPTIIFSLKTTKWGFFSASYIENNTLPEINQLTNNFQLTNYRSFVQGTNYQNPLKNSSISFQHSIRNDEKRLSFTTNANYIKSVSIFNTQNTVNNEFSFGTFRQTFGGETYNIGLSLVNYSRKLKLASKIDINNSWTNNLVNINSSEFSILKSYTHNIKYSATTYLKGGFNFDAGFSYNYGQSVFNNIKTANITKDLFLNINYQLSKTVLLESNNSLYIINDKNYIFNNIILSYNPAQGRLSYRMIINNITNQNQYTLMSLNNYTFYQQNVQLIPRYVLYAIKYRF